jgi:hypothetical protein
VFALPLRRACTLSRAAVVAAGKMLTWCDVGDGRCGALSMSRWNSGIRRHTGAYSLLCEQQFGEGAEFDGEMCACRKGYVRAPLSCRSLL